MKWKEPYDLLTRVQAIGSYEELERNKRSRKLSLIIEIADFFNEQSKKVQFCEIKNRIVREGDSLENALEFFVDNGILHEEANGFSNSDYCKRIARKYYQLTDDGKDFCRDLVTAAQRIQGFDERFG